MANNRIRYKQMERYMTIALIADAVLFILYLLFAGLGILWLKVITAILAVGLAALCLAYLYITQELLKRRSLWMTAGAAAIILCILLSLILNYPSASPVKEDQSAASVSSAAVQNIDI